MPVITYTAKRDIETTGYSKSGTDISANGTNDTFNSVSTVLTGLANDEWVKVAGFANAANNGWFQANGASAATQITQDTSIALVTEAAGPSITLVGYKRGLNQQYSYEFQAQELTRSAEIARRQSKSLSGVVETLRYRREGFWQVELTPIPKADLPRWREILHSVDGGEGFTFDPYGTIAVPDKPLSCDLVADSYVERRESYSSYFTIAFRVREVP